MTKTFSSLFLCLFLLSCNKSKDDSADCLTQAEEGQASTSCTLIEEPIAGTTSGQSTTGGNGETTTGGTSTGGTTTGGTTTGGTTTGGTTTGGTTTGGTTTGGTTTGGTTTGGTTTGGTTTGGTTTGGTTTGGTTTGGSSSLPNEAFTFNANITFFKTTTTQEAKFRRAIDIIKDVVATEEFRSKILNHTYGGKKTFVDNGGLTNAQIYQKILDGAESLQPSKNNTMDMEVELYYSDNSTVGYTYANSKRVWVNRKFFDSYNDVSVARNLMHEWLHKLGFTHASTWSTSRDYSVPYGVGTILGQVGKNFL